MASEADPKHRQCEACSLTIQRAVSPTWYPKRLCGTRRDPISQHAGQPLGVWPYLFILGYFRKIEPENQWRNSSSLKHHFDRIMYYLYALLVLLFVLSEKTIILVWNKICFRPRIWGRGSYNYVKKRAVLNSFWKEWSVCCCSSVAELCLLRPHGLLARQASGVCSNSHPLSQWCHPTVSSSVIPFSSCLQSFPASGSFPMSWLFIHIRWPKFWSFNISISASSEYSGLISFKYIYIHTQRHEQKLWAEKGVRSLPLEEYVHSQALSAALQELPTNSPRGCLRLFPQRPPKDPPRLPGSGYLI